MATTATITAVAAAAAAMAAGAATASVKAVTATAATTTAATAAMAVGILPRPSVSNHSRGRRLICFSQMTARVCGGAFPSYRAQNGPRGERAHLRHTT